MDDFEKMREDIDKFIINKDKVDESMIVPNEGRKVKREKENK